ncbi:glycosyltransferase family 39 protein [Micromonospora sp. BRA006-A]|nr:glycosyltransferase family 39 protein [Micromonospora sp. BRA006-A]
MLRIRQWAYARSFWSDELYVAHNIRERGYLDLLRPLAFSQSAPPGWLWLERLAFAQFGDGERALRLVPLLFGLALLPLVAWLGRRLLPPLAALAALLLVAVAPFLIGYSNELKQYSAEAFGVTLVVGLALLLVRDGVTWAGSAVFWSAAAVMAFVSTLSIPVTGALGVLLAGYALSRPGLPGRPGGAIWAGSSPRRRPGPWWRSWCTCCSWHRGSPIRSSPRTGGRSRSTRRTRSPTWPPLWNGSRRLTGVSPRCRSWPGRRGSSYRCWCWARPPGCAGSPRWRCWCCSRRWRPGWPVRPCRSTRSTAGWRSTRCPPACCSPRSPSRRRRCGPACPPGSGGWSAWCWCSRSPFRSWRPPWWRLCIRHGPSPRAAAPTLSTTGARWATWTTSADRDLVLASTVSWNAQAWYGPAADAYVVAAGPGGCPGDRVGAAARTVPGLAVPGHRLGRRGEPGRHRPARRQRRGGHRAAVQRGARGPLRPGRGRHQGQRRSPGAAAERRRRPLAA